LPVSVLVGTETGCRYRSVRQLAIERIPLYPTKTAPRIRVAPHQLEVVPAIFLKYKLEPGSIDVRGDEGSIRGPIRGIHRGRAFDVGISNTSRRRRHVSINNMRHRSVVASRRAESSARVRSAETKVNQLPIDLDFDRVVVGHAKVNSSGDGTFDLTAIANEFMSTPVTGLGYAIRTRIKVEWISDI